MKKIVFVKRSILHTLTLYLISTVLSNYNSNTPYISLHIKKALQVLNQKETGMQPAQITKHRQV